jgi:hypothetical protein
VKVTDGNSIKPPTIGFIEQAMPDGTLKRTKVSMGTGEIRGNLWKEILRKHCRFLKNTSGKNIHPKVAVVTTK